MASVIKVDQIQSDTGTVNIISNIAFTGTQSLNALSNVVTDTIVVNDSMRLNTSYSGVSALQVEGGIMVYGSSSGNILYSNGSALPKQALIFPIDPSRTTQATANSTGWATIGWASTARSGETMQRLIDTGRYLPPGITTATSNSYAFYIEAGTSEAGGICLDEDSVNVYGSSDQGTTFRIIDKDADLVVAEATQDTWNWNVRGSVSGGASVSSLSDQKLKKLIQNVSEENILEKYSQLQLKSFIRIDSRDYIKQKYENLEELREKGLIAQDVENIFPDCVGITKNIDKRSYSTVFNELGYEFDELKNVNVNQLLYKTMVAVQALIEENETLKARIEQLEQ